jgi:GNAT superfamily N-acetyltransferase
VSAISAEPLTSAALAAAIPALAELRITVFRDWPYLYDGSLEYERGYMEKFSKADGAVIVVARDGARIVGAATASPLLGHADEFAVPFGKAGFDPERIFYFGESVLLSQYRGRGIGNAFFDHREAHARRAGNYTHTAFCAVVRPADHPLRPPGYVPLDAFWMRRGYRKAEGMVASFEWKDIDQAASSDHPMQFWIRAL